MCQTTSITTAQQRGEFCQFLFSNVTLTIDKNVWWLREEKINSSAAWDIDYEWTHFPKGGREGKQKEKEEQKLSAAAQLPWKLY